MNELIYGVWEGKTYDNRRTADAEVPEGLNIEALMTFNSGNPVAGFMAPQGFLVFDHRVTLAQMLWDYYESAKRRSCGRCTPCRIGMQLLTDALNKARRGQGKNVDWDYVARIAQQMSLTSLCGIGLTSPIAFLGAWEHFPELLRDAPAMPPNGTDFYDVATAPCIEACPAHVNIPRYIDYIRDGHPDLATGVLLKHYPLVGSCGRVCVRPCEKACTRAKVDTPVAIKDLKRYAADHAGASIESLFPERPLEGSPVKARVAVIGAGPAGINCAYHLLRRGHQVTIFEQDQRAGGMAQVGIPAYRLPKNLLSSETEVINRLGGQYCFGQKLGRDIHLDELFEAGYRAVFLGVGCGKGQYLNLPNENKVAQGYLKGLDFLVDVEHAQSDGETLQLAGDIVVVGCGNVAMDCARTAKRLNPEAKIYVSYRRGPESAPADEEEIQAAKEEGVEFLWHTAPTALIDENNAVLGLELVQMTSGEPNESGRASLVKVPGTEQCLSVKTVIAAIGQKLDQSIFTPEDGIEINERGSIVVNKALMTTREGVFAGGDAARGPTSLIWGMAQGQTAASSIHEYLMSESTGFIPRRQMTSILKKAHLLENCEPEHALLTQARHKNKFLTPQTRIHHWDEVEFGMSDAEAMQESKRCLRCYRLFALSTLRPIPGKSDMEEL